LVAIAITARTLLIAVGPLLQRSVGYTQHPRVSLSITLPEHLPRGWTGTSNLKGYSPSDLLSAAYHGFALQKPALINVRGCEGQCQLKISAPGLTIQDSDCVPRRIPVGRSDLSSWPPMSDNRIDYVLFLSGFSIQFVDTAAWFGPESMKPTKSLPVPPKDQETVAFHFTQVNVTVTVGTMYSKQCWVRSVTSTHNLTVDSQGFVINGPSVISLEINNDALAGDQYRRNNTDNTSITTLFKELSPYLESSVYFGEDESISDAERGSLGSSNTIEDRSLDDYRTIDPTGYVVYMLDDVYSRAGAIAGFSATDFNPIDPDLPSDQRQLLPRETTGTRTDPIAQSTSSK
jgi:hypothetical protein